MSSAAPKTWNHCMSLLKRCTNTHHLKPLHATFIIHGFHKNNFAMSKLIDLSCHLSNLTYASVLFSQIETPNSFIYNTLINAYSRSTSNPQLGLSYFELMLRDGNVRPDNHTFSFVILGCVNLCWVGLGRQMHDWVIKNGLILFDRYVQTAVMRLYLECGVVGDARKVFDEITEPDVVQWNVLMNGYVSRGMEGRALRVFREMLELGVKPDEFCITTAVAACAKAGALWQGKWIHEYVKQEKGLQFDVFVGTAMVDMYVKCGCVDMAVEVFEMMPERNLFSWAAMIGGFALHGYARKAIQCMQRMQVEDRLRPDGVVVLGVLVACTHAGLLEEGQALLENMEAKYGIIPKDEHYSCVVDLLCRAGRLDEALRLIKRMPVKPLASVWGALLRSCHAHKNVELAELAVQELLQLVNENGAHTDEVDGILVQLSNIYAVAERSEDARKIRRMIGDKGMKKTPGASMIEVDGTVNEFVSGDASHKRLAQIHAILELQSQDSIISSKELIGNV